MNNFESLSDRKLITAAIEHLALKRAAACVLPVPDTDPPLFVAVGPAQAITKLLQDEMPVRATSAPADVQFDESEGGHHD